MLSNGVESGDNGWTANGFTHMTGSTSKVVSHYYLAENRVYSGYDGTLQQGPYNFGYLDTRPDWVERFPYQNGMLVRYVDGEFTDNNTGETPACSWQALVRAAAGVSPASPAGVPPWPRWEPADLRA